MNWLLYPRIKLGLLFTALAVGVLAIGAPGTVAKSGGHGKKAGHKGAVKKHRAPPGQAKKTSPGRVKASPSGHKHKAASKGGGAKHWKAKKGAPAQSAAPAVAATPAPRAALRVAARRPGAAPNRGRRRAVARRRARLRRAARAQALRIGSDRSAPVRTSARTTATVRPSAPTAVERPTATRSLAPPAARYRSEPEPERTGIPRVVERAVESVPKSLWVLVAALAAFGVMALVGSLLTATRARRLARQRTILLRDVGLMQSALLPPVSSDLAAVGVTAAYRPAAGPAAGGDFYDAFAMSGGRLGLIIGDLSGHGRDALAQTALVRFTLRAYLEAELEPRAALRIGGEALGDKLQGHLATVLVAVHDPRTGRLTYASAGHPPPELSDSAVPEPLTVSASPPIGAGAPTGLRQTTVEVPRGSLVCMYTDGLIEARASDDERFGVERLAELVRSLDEHATADSLLADVQGRVAEVVDDMAVCLLRMPDGFAEEAPAVVEEFELLDDDPRSGSRFLTACGVPEHEAAALLRTADPIRREFGAVVLRLFRQGDNRHFEAVPPPAREAPADARLTLDALQG